MNDEQDYRNPIDFHEDKIKFNFEGVLMPLQTTTIKNVSAPRILIVEDERKLLEHLTDLFRDGGFSVFTCATIRELEAIMDLPVKRFDVAILDRLLQGQDSARLIPKIKEQIPELKILILSAINTASEKASMLYLGADDYLAKPFDSDELVARARVLLRRNRPDLQIGNVVLDVNARTLKVNGEVLPLTNKEFTLLKTLIQTPGKIYNKTFLYEQVWQMSTDVESNVVESTITKLRRRLEEAKATVQIKNARNMGYWVEE